MSELSRDQHRWLYSLKLSVDITNVKRDFSNGYAIAEVQSRYYPTEIYMHSYDNGTSSTSRKQNWSLLSKFFTKYGYPINSGHITNIMYNDVPSILHLMDILYTTLTNRSIKHLKATSNSSNMPSNTPSYALPTISNSIHVDLRLQPELRDEKDDVKLAFAATSSGTDAEQYKLKQNMLQHIYHEKPLPVAVLGGLARMNQQQVQKEHEKKQAVRRAERVKRREVFAKQFIERIPDGEAVPVVPLQHNTGTAYSSVASIDLSQTGGEHTVKHRPKQYNGGNQHQAYSHSVRHGYTMREEVTHMGQGKETLRKPPLQVESVSIKVYDAEGSALPV